MREITIIRNKGYYGRFRKIKIFIDRKFFIKIKPGETITIKIPDNSKQMYGRMDFLKTNKFSLNNVEHGDRLEVKAWFTPNPLGLFFGSLTLPIRIEKYKQ